MNEFYKQISNEELPEIRLNAKDLSELIALGNFTRESGIIISGCGCCGSPCINDLYNVAWDKDSNQYYCTLDSSLLGREDGTRWWR